MAFLTAMVVTSALLTPVFWLAQGARRPVDARISVQFNGLGRARDNY